MRKSAANWSTSFWHAALGRASTICGVPNLPDERDDHLMELAVAGNAEYIVTRNLRDVARGELQFTSVRVRSPEQFLKESTP